MRRQGRVGGFSRGNGRLCPSPATPTRRRRFGKVSAYAADVASQRGLASRGGDPSLSVSDRGIGDGRCPPARDWAVQEELLPLKFSLVVSLEAILESRRSRDAC